MRVVLGSFGIDDLSFDISSFLHPLVHNKINIISKIIVYFFILNLINVTSKGFRGSVGELGQWIVGAVENIGQSFLIIVRVLAIGGVHNQIFRMVVVLNIAAYIIISVGQGGQGNNFWVLDVNFLSQSN